MDRYEGTCEVRNGDDLSQVCLRRFGHKHPHQWAKSKYQLWLEGLINATDNSIEVQVLHHLLWFSHETQKSFIAQELARHNRTLLESLVPADVLLDAMDKGVMLVGKPFAKRKSPAARTAEALSEVAAMSDDMDTEEVEEDGILVPVEDWPVGDEEVELPPATVPVTAECEGCGNGPDVHVEGCPEGLEPFWPEEDEDSDT